MKKTTIYLFVSILIAGTFVSCKKDKKSATELLTEKTWRMVKSEFRENSDPYVDEFPFMDACEQDNVVQFLENNTYVITEGATKCDPSDPDISDSGGWTFSQDETHIVIDFQEAVINQLDKNTLVITSEIMWGPDLESTRVTFVH